VAKKNRTNPFNPRHPRAIDIGIDIDIDI